ncbi:protein LTO1 homolog [Daphnia carinata]|uniref:protein LTO1 homolog n=1 Tax=Daphnia carinata TaxID=120202 RepID=UPI00257CD4E1|nr:protein LTO1 homolog [Daphnia carinata]
MAVNTAAVSDFDIQDAFDSLVLSEDNFVNKAYKEGLVHGETVGFQEGFDLGNQKGAEIGSEIFYYRGFAKGWIALLSENECDFTQTLHHLLELCPNSLNPEFVDEVNQSRLREQQGKTNPKSVKALKKLLKLLDCFPQDNPKSQDIIALLQEIRAKFKHCCAILKVDASYSAKGQFNF